MEKEIVEKILEERVDDNKDIFTQKEVEDLLQNEALYVKVYLLGLLDMEM